MTTAKDLPLPGVPKTMEARKGFTTFIQPCHIFFLYQKRVGRLTEYSFSMSRVSCMKDSFSLLNTSSIKFCRSRRDIHTPAAKRQP